MAKASSLSKGTKVIIISGDYAGHEAIVIDPEIVPDDDVENRRKVRVALTSVFMNDDEPMQVYILPRLLAFAGSEVPTALPRAMGMQVAGHFDRDELTVIEHGKVQAAEPITDPMDPALDRFRPNMDVVKRYVSRKVPGGYTDVDYLLHLRDQRDNRGYSPNVALVGETQSGKTMLVQVLAVLAAERDGLPKPYPIFTISGSSGVTSYDLFGQTTAVIIDGRETLVWMNGLVPMALECGGILYLDEWNAVPPSQATALHSTLDDRRMFTNTQRAVPDGHGGFSPEIVNANPGKDGKGGLWIISTINPGYKGTQTLQEATSNRFRWLPFDWDEDVEVALIPSKTVRIIGEALREARNGRQITVPVGTSALQRFNDDCSMFGVDNAVWSFIAMFSPQERDRVTSIIEDHGLLDLLRNEYPTAAFVSDEVELAATWDEDSIAHDDE